MKETTANKEKQNDYLNFEIRARALDKAFEYSRSFTTEFTFEDMLDKAKQFEKFLKGE